MVYYHAEILDSLEIFLEGVLNLVQHGGLFGMPQVQRQYSLK